MARAAMRHPAGLAAVGTALWMASGCAKAPQLAAAQAAPAAAAPAPPSAGDVELAAAKFADFSREVEKMGADERLDAAHAQAELEAVVKIDPGNRPARFDLAALQARRGDGAAAAAAIGKLAAEDADFAPAQENVAADAVAHGELDKATATYRRLIAKFPKNQTSRLALARLLLQQKSYDEAIALCRDVLQRQADAAEAFRVLAASYNATGNVPMAELIIGRGLKANRDDVELHDLLAQILLERDDLAGGVAKLKQVVRMEPKRLGSRAQLAEIALSYRDFGNAAQQYEAILKEQPEAPAVQVNLAVAYKGLGRFDQAEKIYVALLARDKDHVAALWNLGVLYHRHLNRYDDAIAAFAHFKQVAAKDDERVGGVDALLADIQKLKTDQAAQAALQEHERKKKEGLEAACAAVAAGKAPDAAAIGSEQERTEVAWQLMVNAQAAIQGGEVAAGEAQVRCAFAIVPATPAADTGACAPMHVMWTQILYQLGRVDEAQKTIAEALKCDPNNPDAQLIAQQLKELAAAPPAGAAAPAAP